MNVDDVEIGVSRMERGTRDIEGNLKEFKNEKQFKLISKLSYFANNKKKIKASENGGFYIGAIPDNLPLRGMAATKTKLIGSIKDLMFNNQFVMAGEQVQFHNVEFDKEYDTLDRIDRTINKIDKIINKEEVEENEDDLKPLIHVFKP